jgi:hypothetical protein
MTSQHHSSEPREEHPQSGPAEGAPRESPSGHGAIVAPTGKPDELAPADDGPHPTQPPMSEPQPAKVPPGGGTKRGM